MLEKGLLFLENYYRTSNMDQFFSKFNSHVELNLLSLIQEIVWKINDTYDSIFKDMITESKRAVKPKGIDQVILDNYSRINITTNSDWFVLVSRKEKRFHHLFSKNETIRFYR